MKCFTKFFAFAMLFTLISTFANSQTLYRTKATGNWNAPSTWEFSTNSGSTWNASVSTYPTDSAGVVTIRSPHVVTVLSSTTIRIDQLEVNGGATINLQSTAVLDLRNGSGTDLEVANTGVIQGAGSLWANGSGALIVFQAGSNISCSFVVKANATTYNPSSPYYSNFYGQVTVEAGTTLSTQPGGYTNRFFGNVVNNGTIATGNVSGMVDFACASLTNNGNISAYSTEFTDTVNVSGAGTWSSTRISVMAGGLFKLASNVLIGSTVATTFEVRNQGFLDFNSLTMTLGAPTSTKKLEVQSGGATSSLGNLHTTGTVELDIFTGATFAAKLKVLSGITTGGSSTAPYNGIISNDITVDAGATLRARGGGYTVTGTAAVVNNGTISTANSSGTFRMSGPAITNNGVINAYSFDFSTTTNITGAGSWNTAVLSILGTSSILLLSDLNFGSASTQTFALRNGSTLDLNGRKLKLLGTSAQTNLLQEGNTLIKETGMVECYGTAEIDLRTGCTFRPSVTTKSGTTQILNAISPYTINLENSVYVDPAATFRIYPGGYTLTLRDSLVNNGTVSTGNSAGVLRYYGNTLINNGLISVYDFRFESVPVSSGQVRNISGTGSFTSEECVVYDGTYLLLSSDHKFKELTVNSGATLDISSYMISFTGGGAPIVMSGGFINTTGTIEYNGTTAQSMVHTGIDYINLRINNPAGVTVGQNFTIYGALNVVSGDLNLNGKVINFAAGSTLSETPGNTVSGTTGYITTTRNLSAPNNLDVAGFGAIITSTEDFGLTEIRRGHSFYLVSGDTSIRRYYVIRPDNNNGLNATCKFSYDDSELNGNTESSLKMLKSTNVGVSFFVGGFASVDTVNNYATVTSINDFARHTLGPGVALSSITFAPEGFYNTSTQKLNMKDTVRIELRNSTSPFAIVDSATGVLDSVTLAAVVLFPNAVSGNYYIAVKHRNSIETWSKNPVFYNSGSSLIYNFTTSQAQAYGDNMRLKGTKWVVYSGDVNQDGAVDATDVQNVDNDASNFASGYVLTDLNGDGFVDGTDFTIGDNNAANFVGKITP